MKEGSALVLLSASQDQSSRDQPGTSAEAARVVQAVTTTGSKEGAGEAETAHCRGPKHGLCSQGTWV